MSGNVNMGSNVKPKMTFSSFVDKVYFSYNLLVGVPKRVHSIAKSLFSLSMQGVKAVKKIDPNTIRILDKVSLGFRGVAGGFVVLMVPLHIYDAGKNGVGVIQKLFNKNISGAVETGVKFFMNISSLVEDGATVVSCLAAFKVIPEIAGAWVAPIFLVTGAIESIGLVLGSIDHYRVDKFRKVLNEQPFEDIQSYISDPKNAGRISLSLGVDAKKISKFLDSKKTETEREEAIKLLKKRATAKTTSLKLSLISGSIASVATAILAVAFVAPLVAPLLPVMVPIVAVAVPILGAVATTMFIGVTVLSLTKTAHDLIVEHKFKKAIKVEEAPDAPPPPPPDSDDQAGVRKPFEPPEGAFTYF